jgi:hypothetical protein
LGANQDFIIEPFRQRKHEFRADKGKKHIYPKQRKQWNLIRHGQINLNLSLNQTTEQYSVIDDNNSFKNPPEIREYWRIKKREEPTKAKQKKA